jgi:hypothetical protein
MTNNRALTIQRFAFALDWGAVVGVRNRRSLVLG